MMKIMSVLVEIKRWAIMKDLAEITKTKKDKFS